MFNSVPKPPPDASKTHPCRRIHPSDVKNKSVALLFATRNAPLSRISPSGPPKCERGVCFCIPKRTPIANFASRTSKVRAWSHFCAPNVPLSQVLRLGHPKYTNTQTQIHTNTQSYKHANIQTRCEVFLDRRVRSRRHAAKRYTRRGREAAEYTYIHIYTHYSPVALYTHVRLELCL